MTLIFRIWLRYIKPLNKFIKILLLLSLKAYFHYLRSFFSYSIMLIARSFQKAFISAVFVLLHSRGWIWICSQHTASVASSPSKIGLKLLCYCYRNCLVLAQGPRSSRGSNKVTNKNTMQNKWRCWASFAIFFIFHLHDFNNRIKNSSESENLPRGCGPGEQHYSLFQAATGLQFISVWY